MLSRIYLDPTFGNNGKIALSLGNPFFGYSSDITQQPDGKILVVRGREELTLLRYNSDGSLDTGFSGDGEVSLNFNLGSNIFAWNSKILLQPDGKIMAAVSLALNNEMDSAYGAVWIRYNPDGSLDNTFGDGGFLKLSNIAPWHWNFVSQPDGRMLMVKTVFPENSNPSIKKADWYWDFAIQPDGKMLMVHNAVPEDSDPSDYKADIAIARYNPDGSPDTSFGNGGEISSDFGRYETANQIVLQSNGKILVGGWSGAHGMLSRTGDFAVWRYNADGSLDTNFGTGGITTTDFTGWNDDLSSLILQPDGKILAAGTTRSITGDVVFPDSDNNFALVRYNSDGTIDRSFGVNGQVISNFGKFENLAKIALQPDGKILAVGTGNDLASDALYDSSTADLNDFVVARYNPDGSLDSTFGDRGKVLIDQSGQFDQGLDVLPQNNNNFVLVGADINVTSYLLSRYIATLPQPLGTTPRPIDFSQGNPGIRQNGTAKWEHLSGTQFNDVLSGKRGKDYLFGKNGHDRLWGGNQADRMMGDRGNDRLLGEAGDDYLSGGAGQDVLIGGAGVDVLTGGKDRDLFVLSSINDGIDRITDFDPQTDQLDLRSIFKASKFADFTDFERFYRFIQVEQQGSHAFIKLETSPLSNPAPAIWTQWLQLDNCAIESLNLTNFVIS